MFPLQLIVLRVGNLQIHLSQTPQLTTKHFVFWFCDNIKLLLGSEFQYRTQQDVHILYIWAFIYIMA